MLSLLLVAASLLQYTCQEQKPYKESDAELWADDFKHQPIVRRPALEVTYTDSSRTAFQILAENYQLTGQLRTPHRLVSQKDGMPWLWIEIKDEKGNIYSTQNFKDESRINLYRRGPYYSEIHWFDIEPTTIDGKKAPIVADITLYCYPEKILFDVVWHGKGKFAAEKMNVKGITEKTFDMKPFAKGDKQNYHTPLFGEESPLPDDAFITLEGTDALKYDYKMGCYKIGSHTIDNFQVQLYDMPNRYEKVSFKVTNDTVRRKIYICHETTEGGGIVEGGMILDQDGNPMPIVVQVSKNFAAEQEEPFYHPTDKPFSETYFPLYLEPEETHTLTSLHLYQNWGRHMTKHWSSLGAWMDYFHSSTGVTETTCYVPFKFGGLGGVSIADFRAMSQDAFWVGQPQHDNVAGHSFLSYYDGKNWIHSVYTGTTYRSTGPNWYDISLGYISADNKIKATVDIYETPQSDETRSYFKVKYEVLEPLTIDDARAHFRMLNITSSIQELRQSRYAATGTPEIKLDPKKAPFPVKGIKLPDENFFLAIYGDTIKKWGSNAIVVKKFRSPGFAPAGSVQLGAYKNVFMWDKPEDTRLLLVADTDKLELEKGDVIEIEGYWLPYGDALNTASPEKIVKNDAIKAPHIVSAAIGKPQNKLPIWIEAVDNKAEFTIKGGKNLIPVVVSGLSGWRMPRLWIWDNGEWRLLAHSRNNDKDGYQTFVAEDGTFGAVFLVYSDDYEQKLKFTLGEEPEKAPKIELAVIEGATIKASSSIGSVRLEYPGLTFESKEGKSVPYEWKTGEGDSKSYEQRFTEWWRGGRLSPNETDVDLEYWWENREEILDHLPPVFTLSPDGDKFAGGIYKVLTTKGWRELSDAERIEEPILAVSLTSADKKNKAVLTMRTSIAAYRNGTEINIEIKPIKFELRKRAYQKGKLYLTDLDDETIAKKIIAEFY